MTNYELKNKLEIIANEREDSIEKEVAKEALDESYDSPEEFFTLLFKIGCVSGMVGKLTFYNQTHTFYDTHYDQIEEIREEYESSTGQSLPVKYDLKNTFTWYAFENVALDMVNELGIEV